MTHSGLGDEPQKPAARPVQGVVLPSDGSGPWIPGSAEDQDQPPAPLPPQQPPHQPQAYGHDTHAPYAPYGAHDPAQGAGQGYGAPQGTQPYDLPHQQGYPQGGVQDGAGPYGGYGAPEPAPSYGAPGGDPYGASPSLPPQQPQGPQGLPQGHSPSYGQPLPQQYGDPHHAAAPAHQPHTPQGQSPSYGQPLPLPAETPAPAGSADATQYLPPVTATPPGAMPSAGMPPAGMPGSMPGAMPPAAAGADSEATQFIAPIPAGGQGPGVLPPESQDSAADATQFLPPVPAAGAGGADSEATQLIPPVPGGPDPVAAPSSSPYGVRPGAPGDRPPPAEFDNLFRSEGGGAPESTQKMPRIETQAPPVGGRRAARGAQPPQAPPPRQDHATAGGPPPGRGRRTSSRVPLIAAVTAGIVALGLGAGALMSGGGDDTKEHSTTVASSSSPGTTEESPAQEEAPDPVRTQAEALDKLLADSSSSRESVINAVNSIRTCDNLDQAATDLHAAAEQRRGLKTRLDELTVDQLPGHEALTTSLTDAWEASASADDHYAAWAKQVGKKKGCKDGQARVTSERHKGDRASGEATTAKKKASGLWNSIATKYDLTERAPTQL
ncbi:hypothetical protein AB0O07_16885 [Streptomyces sp. NPDC093085]|uniref:hypothetical protein n=1 Tax=Streptomyces sp. NPDC093085 TaxID=3155068 RepID=UPI0034226C40